MAGSESGRLHKGRGMTEPALEVPGWAQLTQDRGIPSVPVPAGSSVCLGEGIPGKQQLKQEQMDPVALGKALECWRLRAGAAGVGSASCASARLLPSPGLGTERVMSQFLRSRKGFIFLGFQSTGAGTHSGSPAQWSGGAGSSLETSTGKISLGWKFPFACRPFLRELFGPRAGSLCKSHVCFVAKLFISVLLSLSGLISVGWCLPGAGSFGRE